MSARLILPILCISAQVATGQTLVKDINQTAPSSYVRALVHSGGHLFFSTGGGPVWVSDGTPEGTREMEQFRDGRPIARLGELVFYQVRRRLTRDYQLWSTDGVTTTFLGVYGFPLRPAGVTPRGLALEGATAGHWVTDGFTMTRVLWQGPRTTSTYYQGDGMAFYVSSWGPARTLQRADGTMEGTHLVDLGV